MPNYSLLMNHAADIGKIAMDLKALRMAGVPYSDEQIAEAYNDAMAQARPESENRDGLLERYGEVNTRDFDGQPNFVSEMDALVAYLQVLGTMAKLEDYDPDLNIKASPHRDQQTEQGQMEGATQ